mgnify:CR=1 FL=1
MVGNRLKYRLISGKDDAEFCQRISALLDEGYVLYGSPAATTNGEDIIVAQAVVLRESRVRMSSNLT